EADDRARIAAERIEVDTVEDAHGAVAAARTKNRVVFLRPQVMVELCDALVVVAGEVLVEAMIDIRGDGDAIAALLDSPRGLLDAWALGRAGGSDYGDAGAGRERARREKCVKRICKPNSVPLFQGARIIHLPLALPRWSSNLPGS